MEYPDFGVRFHEDDMFLTPDTIPGPGDGSPIDTTYCIAYPRCSHALPHGSVIQKGGHQQELGSRHQRNTRQLNQATISVKVIDSGGSPTYFQKAYKLGMKLHIKKVLDQFRSYLCPECSKPQILEFWFKTRKLENGQSTALLGMQTGDTFHTRLKKADNCGPRHLPASQTSPNVHWIDAGVDGILAEDAQPLDRRATVNLTFRNDTHVSMKFRLNMDQPISEACESFGVRLGVSVYQCRFHMEGDKLQTTKTPRELELEDEDIIECYTQLLGGSGQSEVAENFSHRLEPRPAPSVIVEQVTLIFVDGYRHQFPVAIASDSRLQQAFRYAALRMGKNPGHVSFEIAGQRIDFEGLRTKSPADLAIGNGVVVEVRYAPLKAGQSGDPDDCLLPRSVRYGIRPLEGV